MKVLSWKDKDSGIFYRAAWVADNKTTGSKSLRMEQQTMDLTGKPTWISISHRSEDRFGSLVSAILEDLVSVEDLQTESK